MPVPMPQINLVLLLPEIIIALAALGLLLLSAWRGKDEQLMVGQGAMIAIALAAVITYSHADGHVEETFSGLFVDDPFSAFMKMLLYLATLVPLLTSLDYMNRQKMMVGEYFVLTLFALLGGMIMASAGDFMILYLGLEMMSLAIYVLAGFRRDDPASNEAGLKYFVLGSMASGLLLYGVSLIYGGTGSTNFALVNQALADQSHPQLIIQVGVVLVIAGMAFKIAAAPFHMWAPDVYEGAPTSVTAFMAAMPKIAAFAAIYRVLLDGLWPAHAQWGPILQALAVASLAVGALAAIAQRNIKRMLAYSSIGHVGYALIGLATGSALGIHGVLIYLAIYIIMTLGAFALILALGRQGIGEDIDDYRGLAQKRPMVAFSMALFMFSMAGIPPLAGFIGKLHIFLAAVDAGLITLAVIGVLFSAVGAFYYLRIVWFMYFEEASQPFEAPLPIINRLVIALSGAVILVWGVWPMELIAWAESSIQAFL